MLTGLEDADAYVPLDCFESARDEGLGDTLDLINNRFGSAAVGIGHAGIRGKGRPDHQATGPWDMHREKLSKRITTRWDEKLVVYAN